MPRGRGLSALACWGDSGGEVRRETGGQVKQNGEKTEKHSFFFPLDCALALLLSLLGPLFSFSHLDAPRRGGTERDGGSNRGGRQGARRLGERWAGGEKGRHRGKKKEGANSLFFFGREFFFVKLVGVFFSPSLSIFNPDHPLPPPRPLTSYLAKKGKEEEVSNFYSGVDSFASLSLSLSLNLARLRAQKEPASPPPFSREKSRSIKSHRREAAAAAAAGCLVIVVFFVNRRHERGKKRKLYFYVYVFDGVKGRYILALAAKRGREQRKKEKISLTRARPSLLCSFFFSSASFY